MKSKMGKQTNALGAFRECLAQDVSSGHKRRKRRHSDSDNSSPEDKVFDLQNNIMTDKDITVYFQEQIMNYQYIIENDRCLQEQHVEKVLQGNPLLRYQEKLHLNRKGHQPAFKAITRDKRTFLNK